MLYKRRKRDSDFKSTTIVERGDTGRVGRLRTARTDLSQVKVVPGLC